LREIVTQKVAKTIYSVPDGIARRYICIPKIPIWYILEGLGINNVDILQTFGVVYDNLIDFEVTWYIFSYFGILNQ
jgi:hypothetical protein